MGLPTSQESLITTYIMLPAVLFVLAVAYVQAKSGLGTIQKIVTQTSTCEDCDMTLLGQVNVKICTGSPELCCAIVNIADFDSGYFQLGHLDEFQGSRLLQDCDNYSLDKVTNPADLKLKVYHEGSDGGQLDWIEVHTNTKTVRCYLGVWMDEFSQVTGQCQ